MVFEIKTVHSLRTVTSMEMIVQLALLGVINSCLMMTSVKRNVIIKHVAGITSVIRRLQLHAYCAGLMIHQRIILPISMWTELTSKMILQEAVLYLTHTEV